jgi:HK97 family phage prohead protease
MTTTAPARLRTFTGGERPLEVPVDSLGRMRHRATLDVRTVARAMRADGDTEIPTANFHGHAAVFNKRTLIGGKRWGFWEQIDPGAFDKTIGEADVRFLVNHDPNLVMARNKAGTLDLSTDATGLVTDAPALDLRQSYTNDAAIALERGDISQMSFAFEPIEWRYEEAEDGKALYTMTEVRLWDVSIVTYPAYEETDAGLRGLAFEAMTRSLGLDAAEILARLDADDLGAYLTRQIALRPGAAEPGPVDATRTTSPPVDATGAPFHELAAECVERHRKQTVGEIVGRTITKKGRQP